MSNPGLSQIKQTDQTYRTCNTNTNKFKHTNKQHSKQTLLNPNGAIEARVGGRETKMVRAIGTDAFTESEEHWHGVPFEVLPLRTVRRAGRLRRQVQRPLEGYIHVPTDYRGTAYRSRR